MPNHIDLDSEPTPEAATAAAEWLARSGYRVIRPLQVRNAFSEDAPPRNTIKVAVLDTETTGTNPGNDKLIELGIVVVEVCPITGQAFRVLREFNELEDPGVPIPVELTKIHGITDAMVSGRYIRDDDVSACLADVEMVIAHNAGFDRAFAERRFPIFSEMNWACSFAQLPWSKEGISSAKLEYLAYRYGFHYSAHRASIDCRALLEILQHPLPVTERKTMQVLLANALQADIRLSALATPFESKDLLKQRGYRWNAEMKVWATRLVADEVENEAAWLRESVYRQKPFKLSLETHTAKTRFSGRSGQQQVIEFS